MAAEYLMREGDRARFKEWLYEHSERERATIVAHLWQKGARRGP
jgi:hypothetical protein